MPVAGTIPRITYDNGFLRRGVAPPEPLFEVQPLSPVIRQLLRESDLVTILPLVVVENEVAAGTLKLLPFDDEIAFPIHLTQRQVRYPSAARDYVIDEVKELFRERARRKAPPRGTARTRPHRPRFAPRLTSALRGLRRRRARLARAVSRRKKHTTMPSATPISATFSALGKP